MWFIMRLDVIVGEWVLFITWLYEKNILQNTIYTNGKKTILKNLQVKNSKIKNKKD